MPYRAPEPDAPSPCVAAQRAAPGIPSPLTRTETEVRKKRCRNANLRICPSLAELCPFGSWGVHALAWCKTDQRLRGLRPPGLPPVRLDRAQCRYDGTMAICHALRSEATSGPPGCHRSTLISVACVRVSPQCAYAILIRYANCVFRFRPSAHRPHRRCAHNVPIRVSPPLHPTHGIPMARAMERGFGG